MGPDDVISGVAMSGEHASESLPSSEACATLLISDIPADHDQFGAHSRIAEAVAESIRAEAGGRSIGIEGPWGSGKSTVVNLLKARLAAPDVHTWVFDAWAHEGDPLRRTFLEGLITELLSRDWLVPREKWEKELRKLSRREKVVRTRSKPRVPIGGYLVAFGLVLVPFGVVLFRAGVGTGISLRGVEVNELALLGGLLIAGPLLVPLIAWVLMQILWFTSPLKRKSARLVLRDVFTPLAKVHDIEVVSESIEDPEPTSVDFAAKFDDCLAAALPDRERDRRLVIVLDNLDRLASDEQAKRIWATIQPYLQPSNRFSWQERFWMIVTYDRSALYRLAPTREKGQSYVDKTIRVEYSVPPPVLSNWRSYLRGKLNEALPNHPPAELDAVTRLISVLYPDFAAPPTPRELVQIINSLGAFHRQWDHSISLLNIAYHVVAKRRGSALDEPIHEGTKRLLTRTIADDRYSLEFGVPLNVARQLRVGIKRLPP